MKPESGHNGGRRDKEKKCRGQISAKSGIANDRSSRGAPKEAKGGKASNQSRMKEDVSKGDHGPSESWVSAKGSVVPERKAVEWGGKVES